MGKGHQKGNWKGKWKQRDEERLQRNDDIDRRYNATSAYTTPNSTAFIFCLSLYLRGLIIPDKEQMKKVPCFVYFSKWLFWFFRHGKELLHDTPSLTLNELFHFN